MRPGVVVARFRYRVSDPRRSGSCDCSGAWFWCVQRPLAEKYPHLGTVISGVCDRPDWLWDVPQTHAGIGIDYTFETWGTLLVDFCREVVGEPAFLVANSIGCIAAMQAAATAPDWVRGIVQLNCSLRLLHERRRASQNLFERYGTGIVQNLLAIPAIGQFFFSRVATAKTVRTALSQAYIRKTAITDDLIEMLLAPSRSPRAWKVFVAFTRYSQGPLPEDLLPALPCRTLLVWAIAIRGSPSLWRVGWQSSTA